MIQKGQMLFLPLRIIEKRITLDSASAKAIITF